MAKTKKVKTKGPKAKRKKRMSKGAKNPWQVWSLYTPWGKKEPEKLHSLYEDFKTENKAKAGIKNSPRLIAPVIIHIDIPPMEH